MGPLPSADLTPAYPGVAPLGLGTADVESFTGYVVRLGNTFAVPASVLLTHSLNAVLPPARRDLHYRRNGALNGAGPAVLHAAGGIAHLTGEPEAHRLSFHGLVDLLHLVDRDLVSPTRRWCPLCWADDPEPYDRKFWWLAVVDACPVHGCLLESRCGTCGRLQPSLTRGVRLNACSYCGHELSDSSSAAVLPSGPVAERLLWYARQGGDLIHAAEVVALMQSDEAASLNAAYARLAAKARDVGFREVASEFEKMRTRRAPRAGWVEALFSALWRLDEEVLVLFSPAVQAAVRSVRQFAVPAVPDVSADC